MTGLKMIGIGRAMPGRCVQTGALSKLVEPRYGGAAELTGHRRTHT